MPTQHIIAFAVGGVCLVAGIGMIIHGARKSEQNPAYGNLFALGTMIAFIGAIGIGLTLKYYV